MLVTGTRLLSGYETQTVCIHFNDKAEEEQIAPREGTNGLWSVDIEKLLHRADTLPQELQALAQHLTRQHVCARSLNFTLMLQENDKKCMPSKKIITFSIPKIKT